MEFHHLLPLMDVVFYVVVHYYEIKNVFLLIFVHNVLQTMKIIIINLLDQFHSKKNYFDKKHYYYYSYLPKFNNTILISIICIYELLCCTFTIFNFHLFQNFNCSCFICKQNKKKKKNDINTKKKKRNNSSDNNINKTFILPILPVPLLS